MLAYFIRRTLQFIPTIIGVTLIIFLLLNVLPGNAALMAGGRKELTAQAIEELKDLKWRYEEGPSGRGRANLGFTNSTGCSSVWGSSYPYNPYPFPWVNHLFQDAPSVAVGIFEGHMRKMADGFISVRRAEKLLDDSYDATEDEAFFDDFEWEQFTTDEFTLCPPLFAVGGDGAMMDIGFQNLSRVMATNKPIRVIVVDTQVYSNTGGQACTSGFMGQVSDMASYGKAWQTKGCMRYLNTRRRWRFCGSEAGCMMQNRRTNKKPPRVR